MKPPWAETPAATALSDFRYALSISGDVERGTGAKGRAPAAVLTGGNDDQSYEPPHF